MAEDLAQAWERVVLAEAAVSYAYAVAGPRLADTEHDDAAVLYDEHERARDDALLALTAAGGGPVSLPTFYQLPDDVTAPEQARALLATVESRLATAYADLVAALPVESRQVGLDGTLEATHNALRWGAPAGPWGAAEPAA